MAHVFGSKSQYLVSQEKYNRRISKTAISIVLLILGMAVPFIFDFVKSNIDSDIKIAIFLILSAIFFYLCYKLLFAHSRTELFSKHYSQGLGGEDLVFAELIKLPEQYCVFRDIVIHKGNIDFGVVHPHAIFSIEVKSHRGKITFDGHQLLRNGYPFRDGDFFQQTWREAKDMKDLLENKLGHPVYIVPLLVFSDPRTYVDIDPRVQQKFGVHVLHSRMLSKFIQDYQGSRQLYNMSAIIEFLKPFIKES